MQRFIKFSSIYCKEYIKNHTAFRIDYDIIYANGNNIVAVASIDLTFYGNSNKTLQTTCSYNTRNKTLFASWYNLQWYELNSIQTPRINILINNSYGRLTGYYSKKWEFSWNNWDGKLVYIKYKKDSGKSINFFPL